MKILVAQINPTIGDISFNAEKVLKAIQRAQNCNADIVLLPELALSGYPPRDLLLDHEFIHALMEKLRVIAQSTKGLLAVIGIPRINDSEIEKPLFNSAAILRDGQLIGFHDKQLLPTYDIFDERRYFQNGSHITVIEHLGRKIAITIGEDLWQHSHANEEIHYSIDPVEMLQEEEIDCVLNLSGSPFCKNCPEQRIDAFSKAARDLQAPIILCNQTGANDELIFDGYSFALDSCGNVTQIAKGFCEDDLLVDLDIRHEIQSIAIDPIDVMHQAIVMGIDDYFHKQKLQKAVIGL